MKETKHNQKNIYIQNICGDCLQMLVNNESNHEPQELEQYHKTLDQWYNDNYTECGPNYDDNGNIEPFFSWHHCDICDGLPGMRYEYNFIDKSVNSIF
jgi:hypothetical protein